MPRDRATARGASHGSGPRQTGRTAPRQATSRPRRGEPGPRRYPLARADHVPRPGRPVRRDQGRQHPVRPVVQPLLLRRRGTRSRPTTGSIPNGIGHPTYLYVSHLHHDHFDPRYLAAHVDKSATVLLPDYPLDDLEKELTASSASRRSSSRRTSSRSRPGRCASRSTPWWPRPTARSATRRCSSTTARCGS